MVNRFFFLKLVFFHLNERQKLELLKYNRSLQNNFEISLINYKYFSGRYIEYQPDGNIKAFNSLNNKLVYEGGYLNGKKNGKGKEYDEWNDILEFEGEYLNGKRNGKGKEYCTWHNGRLEFEGEYLNGKRISGKQYTFNGIYLFDGSNGYGKQYNDSGFL